MDTEISLDDKYYPIGYVVKQEPASSSSQVPEGTAVKTYVCAGYKYSVEIDLPKDFKAKNYYVSLWENGQAVKTSNKIDSSELSVYTFKDLVTKENSVELTVKISADGKEEHDLYDVIVDCKTGRVKIDYEYSYPTKDDAQSGNNSNSSSKDEGTDET